MRVRLGVMVTGDSLRLAEDSVTLEHVSFSNVGPMSVYGLGSDSLISDSAIVSTLYFPLRKDADSCSLVVEYDGAIDIVRIFYTRNEMFVSLACGCAVMATLDSIAYTTNRVDSVKITNAAVTTNKETHLSVFVHKL